MQIQQLVSDQRTFFNTGATKSIAYRRAALKKLEDEILRRQTQLAEALHQDLGKASFEAYMTEIGLTLSELNYARRHVGRWAKKQYVPTPLMHFPSRSYRLAQPYGVALIMAPWNYPFLLSISPLVGAIAAGNCVVLKPSAYAGATSRAMHDLLAAIFPPEYIAVVEGGRSENTALLEQRFDHIFFTGSEAVGKLVMQAASQHLTPVTLELGGKSPCIVDETAPLRLAATRIAFGKCVNAGQTCVAPDYLLVQRSVAPALLPALQDAIHAFFGKEPLQNANLPKIINQKHFERLLSLMEGQNIRIGGKSDNAACRIEPTVLWDVSPDSAVMQEEIFGPILPVILYDTLDEAIAFVNGRAKPLAFYAFSNDKAVQQKLLDSCSFGGGCINDTLVHLASSRLPFGGVGASGMGSYHGEASFETFSHRRSILHKANWLDIPARYHPYSAAKEKFLRFFLK